jgi:hypothetical protein
MYIIAAMMMYVPPDLVVTHSVRHAVLSEVFPESYVSFSRVFAL